MRRGLGLLVGLAVVIAGCGRAAPPFFLVHNDQSEAVQVSFCASLICRRSERQVIAPGHSGRFVNLTGAGPAGLLSVTESGHQSGCASVPPAIVMVDRLYVFAASSLLASQCPVYNPARPLGLPRPASRR